MIRKIIQINEEQCNGCGLCAQACHESAIAMVDGKARLMRDDYCDGLGDCLPVCPTGAIAFVEREAAEYDEEAVLKNKEQKRQAKSASPCGCPGSRAARIHHTEAGAAYDGASASASQLRQWPVQLKLAPAVAPYFKEAHLLIAADCAAYAYGNFHQDFIRDKIPLIGCPKLDDGDYSEKLTAIIRKNEIGSVTVVRMEVPCCCGIERAVRTACQQSGKALPLRVVTISTNGRILES